MSPKTFTCAPEIIARFLNDELASDVESAFIEHLTSCDACRAKVDEAAAEKQEWRDAECFLPNDARDVELLNIGSCDQDDRDPDDSLAEIASAQINHVLGVLGPTDDPNMLGRLGGYEVSGVVGSGGMGVVIKALDTSLDRAVAIKVLAPHLASSGAARRRFSREAKAAAAVIHPNIIAIHGVSNDAALPYLVMPYVRGLSLQKRLDINGPLGLVEILRIGQQIAAGLSAAHAQGLVHRDIKPANILLADGVERVTITDFGLARAVDDASMTRSGVIAGTPQYMSPEQARGEAIDARSDLFSLGSLMYAMCTARPPFRAETSFGVMRRITDDQPRSIREINPEIPTWLCRLIEKLQSKSVGERIQSAEEVEQTLQQCLAHLEQPSTNRLPDNLSEPKAIPFRWAMVACASVLVILAVAFGKPWDAKPYESRSQSDLVASPPTGLPTGPPTGLALQVALPPDSGHQELASESTESDAARWDDGISEQLQHIGVELERLDEPRTSAPTQSSFAPTVDVTLEDCVRVALANLQSRLQEQGLIGESKVPDGPYVMFDIRKALNLRQPIDLDSSPQPIVAILDSEISLVDLEQQVANIARDTELAYWDLSLAYTKHNLLSLARQQSKQVWRQAKRNFELGTATRQEVARAERQYITIHDLASSQHVRECENRLRQTIGLSGDDGQWLNPVDAPMVRQRSFDWQQSVSQLLKQNPKIRRERQHVANQELQLAVVKSALPSADLQKRYRWLGIQGPATEKLNADRGTIDLELAAPLGARRTQMRLRNETLRLKRAEAQLRESERLCVQQLSDAAAKALTKYQLAQTGSQRVRASEHEVATRLQEFEAGRTPINVLLQSHQRKLDATTAKATADVEYRKSINFIDYLTGDLLAKHHVSISRPKVRPAMMQIGR